jgi:hypothetical protein
VTNPAIEASKSKSALLIWAILSTIAICIVIYKEGRSIFDWTRFNPNMINEIVFFLLSVGCINWWWQFFDNRPVLKLNSEGVWVRIYFLFFSKTIQIPWTQVNYFYILEETRKSTIVSLMIGQKGIEKENKIDISILDKSMAEILTVMTRYSTIYNFQDLGKDSKL